MEASMDVRTSLAINRGAVTATEFIALTDETGVPLPLDKGDHQVVISAQAPCCNHGSTRAVQPLRRTLFETSEHMLIPFGLNLRFESGVQTGQSAMLTLQPNFRLTYGQIIALGGDFYGDPARPICKEMGAEAQMSQFSRNYQSLVASGQEVTTILRIAKKFEFDPLAAAIRQGQVPSGVFVRNSAAGWGLLSDADRAYDAATGGVNGGRFGRYVNIASTNFDHFGTDAIAAYVAGHTLAQQMAVKAHALQNPADRAVQLQGAYAANAFADHFLTDLFSAGHMRTPRRPIYDIAWTEATQAAAGLLAQRMHDEENKFGVWVENQWGDRWVAYGDKRYRDQVNTANRRMVKRAVQKSMDEVWQAFETQQVLKSDSDVLKYLPKVIWEITHEPTASQHREDRRNWSPLFWRNPADGNVWRREGLFNPADRTYGEYSAVNPFKWGLSSTLAQIKYAGTPPYMPDAEYRKVGLPVYPDEAGPSGEFGWPAGPTAYGGWSRVMHGATGPNLRDLRRDEWVVDGAPGPTAHLNGGVPIIAGEPVISAE
jgi:hypothetical protein